MANDITGNPWILDIAGSVTTSPFKCNYLQWTPTTDGDDLLVVDNAGNTVWPLKAIAADANQGISYEKRIDGSINGLSITTIDNGTLYVHL
jgi:tetrahydromethanopterin S-methyltransferase subunit H